MGFNSPAVGGLHDARAAAGNNAVAGLNEGLAYFDSQFVFGVAGFDPRRAKNANGRADLRQRIEAFNKFALTAQEPTTVLVRTVPRFIGFQEPLIARSRGDLITAERQRALLISGQPNPAAFHICWM